MAPRSFFRKAVALRDKPPKVRKPPAPPDPQFIQYYDAVTGKGVRLSPAFARQRMGASKGGTTTQARGLAHRWTSETARKAAQKLWRTRYKLHKRIGVHVGVRSNRKPRIAHAPLRARYALTPTTDPKGIWYDPFNKKWFEDTRCLTERTALRKLGHLPPKHKMLIPGKTLVSIKPVRQQSTEEK